MKVIKCAIWNRAIKPSEARVFLEPLPGILSVRVGDRHTCQTIVIQ